MNTKELIKLAYKADIEGDLELADFIDRELLAISNNKNIKEAALTDTLGKMGRGVGNFFGNIGNFLGGYGGYNGPTNNAGARKLVEQAPQFKGLGKTFGAVTQEVRHTPDELAELANGLKKSMINSRSKATPEVQAAMDTLMDGKAIGTKAAFAPQAPDTTGSAIPDGPAMTGMPQLNPGMGGFGGGYNGPQAGPPQGNNYNPQQNIGMGSVNSAIDPKSFKESAGVAPKTEYSERNERGINPAARFRSYEGMTRGESAPVYNYNNYNAGYNPGPQSAVSPIQTPVAPVAAPVANVAQLESIPPVTIPTAQGLAGQTGFGGATDSAGIAAELFGDQAPPQPPPMTPEQIQSTMNPLATVGY